MQKDKDQYCITFEQVEEALQRVRGAVCRTPLLKGPSSMNVQGKELYFKVEAMQHTGSFKFRGALNAIKSQIEQKTAAKPLCVVTHSSGNHAQALALAAKLCDTEECPVKPATIVMPRGAPRVKQEATRSYGGEVILCDNSNEARQEKANLIVSERGASFIHPSENPFVIAGQGTVSLEIIEQFKDFGVNAPDAIIIPVGGGGLASGNAIALRALLSDKIKIILAEPKVLDDAKRSFDCGQHVKHNQSNKLDSVADGLKTTLGPNTWPIGAREVLNHVSCS